MTQEQLELMAIFEKAKKELEAEEKTKRAEMYKEKRRKLEEAGLL